VSVTRHSIILTWQRPCSLYHPIVVINSNRTEST